MPTAFILVDIMPGHERFVQERLRRLLPSIEFAHQVTGEHDLFTFLNAEPYEELAITVASIRRIEGVRDTETLLVLA